MVVKTMLHQRSKRLARIFLLLAALVMVPFFIWGGSFSEWLNPQELAERLRGQGMKGALLVIALLIGDLFLPIPATVVMAASGYIYGGWLGGAINVVGSMLAGMLAYNMCRKLGRSAAERLTGNHDFTGEEEIFARHGFWLIALSRWLPVFPEVMACMAGLMRMPARSFHLALLSGTLPMGFAYGFMGQSLGENPLIAAVIGILPPAFLWLVFRKLRAVP